MKFDNIEVTIFKKRVTVSINGLLRPYSCYDIKVLKIHLTESHGVEIATEVDNYIKENCEFLEEDSVHQVSIPVEEKAKEEPWWEDGKTKITDEPKNVKKKRTKKGFNPDQTTLF